MLNATVRYNDINNFKYKNNDSSKANTRLSNRSIFSESLGNDQSISFKNLNQVSKTGAFKKILQSVQKQLSKPFVAIDKFQNGCKKVGEEIGNDLGHSLLQKSVKGKRFTQICEKFGEDGFFNMIANPIKDLVACGLYVQASLNNKKIPEERRPFVATMDGVNGIVNVSLQLLLGVTALSKPVVEGTTKFIFGQNATKKEIKAVESLAGLVVGTIFAKRILSYLISTPIATSLKDKFASKKGAKPPETKQDATKSAKPEQKTATLVMLSTPKPSDSKSSELFVRFQQKKV